MNHLVINFQYYYIMFEKLEYSWVTTFLEEMQQAHDLDELTTTHDKQWGFIMEKSSYG